ncbi:transposase-like protein [Sinorhizobium meliloti]
MILNAIAEKLKRQSKDDFKGRHFEAWLIVQAVAWYLRYPLSYRNLEEMFRERGFEVDHSTINRWVLAYAPMIEKRLRQFRRPHCGSVRIDETYVKIRGRWRYLYRAIDKHGSPVDFLLTAKRDLDAAKRFFRKMLKEEPLLSPEKIGTGGANTFPSAIKTSVDDGLLHRPGTLCHQTSAARHRERPFQSEEEHAEDRRLSILPNGAADDRGFRSDVVAAERLRLRRRLDRQRSERSARAPLRTSKG